MEDLKNDYEDMKCSVSFYFGDKQFAQKFARKKKKQKTASKQGFDKDG